MFLKIEQHFEIDNVFILLESSWIGGICIVYLSKLKICKVSSVYLWKIF